MLCSPTGSARSIPSTHSAHEYKSQHSIITSPSLRPHPVSHLPPPQPNTMQKLQQPRSQGCISRNSAVDTVIGDLERKPLLVRA
ncbi:hypothetical protein E4U43_003908 [Claviceps pusilla]|uniref:Uncharacterized protein n=1 Tax=Claviceps pusilla TaxID=123648 RepID=A0A9P7SXD3_9HYPO|nr:hypothetical protein E4U43_003908 [Claviceps pusilla]